MLDIRREAIRIILQTIPPRSTLMVEQQQVAILTLVAVKAERVLERATLPLTLSFLVGLEVVRQQELVEEPTMALQLLGQANFIMVLIGYQIKTPPKVFDMLGVQAATMALQLLVEQEGLRMLVLLIGQIM
jgi:hypothetical protein